MSNIENSFTAPQIEFLTSTIFDALSTHFGYSLSKSKREKVMALALNAERGNYNALLQRAERLSGVTLSEPTPLQPTATATFCPARALIGALNDCDVSAQPLLVSMHHLRISDWQYLTLSKMMAIHVDPTADGVFAKLEGVNRLTTLLSRLDPVGNISLLRLLQVAVTEYKTTTIHFVDQKPEDLDTPLPDFSEPLTNDNCLIRMRCPCCGEQDSFAIETLSLIPNSRCEDEPEGVYDTFWATWEDDGSTETEGPTEFPDAAGCICRACGAEHPIEAFLESSETSWNATK